MSSAKSVAPLHIELQPSRRLRLLLTCLYGGAAVSVLLLSISLPEKLALVVVVLLSYPVSLNRIGWFDGFNTRFPKLFRPPVTALHWHESGDWQLLVNGAQGLDQSGVDSARQYQQGIAARLSPSSTVHPLLTIMNFYCEEQPWYRRRRAIVLLPDSLAVEDFRRLRVSLLSHPLQPADSGAE